MPKKDVSLGRTLIRAHKKGSNFVIRDGYRHACDIPDGRDFARLNLKSCTEQTSLDDFLYKAELAEKDFISEFSDIKIIESVANTGILTENEKAALAVAQDKNKEILCVPRRPSWDSDTSKEELDSLEKESFLNWRRKLALSQEEENLNLTPYEKNLEIWRQLWRVVERSDVVVQILDSRNPLLFRCFDLEEYVKEIDERKNNVLLLNKADFLTEEQRQHWCEYFEKIGVQIAFFSALEEMNRLSEEICEAETNGNVNIVVCKDSVKNSNKILSREELLSFFKSVAGHRSDEKMVVVGLVGYPNVGKSSTLNALLMSKRASVSATPGKTKHFQTFLIEKDLCLCDCPGLVFPNFISSKAEMVTNGILPIDQLTNWVQPVSIITSVIPKKILESTYSIFITTPGENRDKNSAPTAEEFLNAHGYNRGYMTTRGIPDNARSARYVLKDFVNGRLLYCHAPPGVDQNDYHKFPEVKPKKAIKLTADTSEKANKDKLSEADNRFFTRTSAVHTLGKSPLQPHDPDAVGKPWKKHHNKNKREKLRRIYRHA